MAHIFTYDEIKQEFEDRGYILITDHKLKGKEKYEYICKRHPEEESQFIDWVHFHNHGHGCQRCGIEKCGAARRKDLSEYDGKTLAESKGFEYIGMSRHDKKIWVQFICPNHRRYGVQEMPYNNMQRVVVGCQHCIGRNDDEEIILDEMYDANPDIEVLEPIKGRRGRIKIRCKKHDNISNSSPYEIIHGKGCIYCGFEKLSETNKTPKDIFIEQLKTAYNNIELESGYNGKTNYASFHCKICDAKWTGIAYYVENRGCPRCNGFSTEAMVGKYLQQYKINYIPQKSFSDCRDQRPLPFDFYLPDYNILIEYDGEEHFRPVNFGGISDDEALEHLKITQYHDKIKTNYCQENGIPLIRIPFWEKKNIQNILLKELKQYVLIQDN